MDDNKRSAAFQAASARWKRVKTDTNPGTSDVGKSLSRVAPVRIEMNTPPVGRELDREVILVESDDEASLQAVSIPSSILLILENPARSSSQDTASYVTLKSLMGSPDLEASFQFNFSVDLEFAMSQFHPNVSRLRRKVTFVVGSSVLEQDGAASIREKYNVCEIIASLPNRFASHHTKMMINFYPESMEVVIMTCNLTKLDVLGLSQMVWRSGKLYERTTNISGSESCFKMELQSYLRRYKSGSLNRLAVKLDGYDFLDVTVELLSSAPGNFDMNNPASSDGLCGYGRLRQILSKHRLLPKSSGTPLNILAQVTSIAYPFLFLKGRTASVFTHILCPLIATNHEESRLLPPGSELSQQHQKTYNYTPHIVFPTSREVAMSHVGYASGQAIHFNYTKGDTHRQQYIQNVRPYLRKYADNVVELVMPHTKLLICDNGDNFETLKWVAMGSHNLSKQAWGAPSSYKTLDPNLYKVDSYELGVVVIPPDGKRLVPSRHQCRKTSAANISVALPIMLPPKPYGSKDEPWSMHKSFPGILDRFGQEYLLDS